MLSLHISEVYCAELPFCIPLLVVGIAATVVGWAPSLSCHLEWRKWRGEGVERKGEEEDIRS